MDKITIVIPFYNAKDKIFEHLVQNIRTLLDDKKIGEFCIILVNDGSVTKNHQAFIPILENLLGDRFSFIDLEKNKGKGGAIKEGMKCVTSNYAVFYDIDFPFGIDALYRICNELKKEKTDIVIAKRDDSYNQKLPWERKIISTFVRKVMLWISEGKVTDSQAGLKGMTHKILPLFLSTEANSFIVDFEFLLKAVRQNHHIKEVIVTPNSDIEFTNFSNKTLIKELKTLVKILLKRKK